MTRLITESMPMIGGAAGSVGSSTLIVTKILESDGPSLFTSILLYVLFTIFGALVGYLVRSLLNLIECKVRNAFLKKQIDKLTKDKK